MLTFCLKALLSRDFGHLSAPVAARQSESLPPTQSAKALGSSRLSFVLWLPFNLWAIVYLPNSNDSNSMKHIKITGNILKTASESAIIKMVFYTL